MSVMETVRPMNGGQPSLNLPKIVHPSLRTSQDPDSIQITARAVSRASSLGRLADKMSKERTTQYTPLLNHNETSDTLFVKSKNKISEKPVRNAFESQSLDFTSYNIPAGVSVVYTPDVNKLRMPVFGNRPNSMQNQQSNTSRSLGTAPPSQQMINVDEYYDLLKDKMKYSFHEVKTKFKNADPLGKGGVSKEALAHIIASILGPSKQLSHQNYMRLLDKLDLKSNSIVKYEDFRFCFQEHLSGNEVDENSASSDHFRSSSSVQIPVNRKATQVFVILKEKAKLKTSEMVLFVPQLIDGEPSKIFRVELLGLLNKMTIRMEEEEFEKLWKKFDNQNTGFVKSGAFLKRLGVSGGGDHDESDGLESARMSTSSSIPYAQMTDKPVNSYKVHKSSTTKAANPVEKWLKVKFREGFVKMKASFEEMDPTKTGQVRRDQFLGVLRQHGLQLDVHLLDPFLQRCEIKTKKSSTLVPYIEFLEKFQNRSDTGLVYRFIAADEYDEENDDDRPYSMVGKAEQKLIKLFQNDFLNILQKFRSIDRAKNNTISKQEFRAAIESHFSIELSDADFAELLRDVPCTNNDRVEYLEFMTKFDSDKSSTLFDTGSIRNEEFRPRIIKKYEPIEEGNEVDEDQFGYEEMSNKKKEKELNGRSVVELKDLIKEIIKTRFKEVEKAWTELDVVNSNEMTKGTMYQLLKKLKINPEVSHDEVEKLWKVFILKDNKKLEFLQFVRQIAYSKKSAAFENAKIAPPTHGDSDIMQLSKTLSTDKSLVRETVLHKLHFLYENLRKCFMDLDPHFTNIVLREEFEEVLLELCPDLNKMEMNHFCENFENNADGRINYKEFLKPFAPKMTRDIAEENANKKDESLSSRIDMNDPLVIKIKMRLSEHFKELRKSFKKNDYRQTGFVTIAAFKEVLKATKSNLNDEDMFNLIQRLDKDISGMVNYNKFIGQYLKSK